MARSIGLMRMKRRRYIILSIVSVVVVFILLGAGAFVIGQTNVSPQAIASSVTRTPELGGQVARCLLLSAILFEKIVVQHTTTVNAN